MMAAVSAFGPAALLVAVAPPELAVAAAGAMVLVDSFGIGLHGVNQVSVRQAVTAERLRGRTIATLRCLNLGALPLGTMSAFLEPPTDPLPRPEGQQTPEIEPMQACANQPPRPRR